MSKLFPLKDALSIIDTAARLSATLAEPVTETDVYQLCYDGCLPLSWRISPPLLAALVDPTREKLNIVPELPSPSGEYSHVVEGSYGPVHLTDMGYTTAAWAIYGVYELVLTCHKARTWLSSLIQGVAHHPPIRGRASGVLYLRGSDGRIWHPTKSDEQGRTFCVYIHPAPRELVIRREDIEVFEASLTTPDEATPAEVEKPLHTKERVTMLVIIGALLHELNCKPDKRGLAKRIRMAAEQEGAAIDEVTILNHLSQVPQALQDRNKAAKPR